MSYDYFRKNHPQVDYSPLNFINQVKKNNQSLLDAAACLSFPRFNFQKTTGSSTFDFAQYYRWYEGNTEIRADVTWSDDNNPSEIKWEISENGGRTRYTIGVEKFDFNANGEFVKSYWDTSTASPEYTAVKFDSKKPDNSDDILSVIQQTQNNLMALMDHIAIGGIYWNVSRTYTDQDKSDTVEYTDTNGDKIRAQYTWNADNEMTKAEFDHKPIGKPYVDIGTLNFVYDNSKKFPLPPNATWVTGTSKYIAYDFTSPGIGTNPLAILEQIRNNHNFLSHVVLMGCIPDYNESTQLWNSNSVQFDYYYRIKKVSRREIELRIHWYLFGAIPYIYVTEIRVKNLNRAPVANYYLGNWWTLGDSRGIIYGTF